MPTPAERSALLFVAAVAAFGVGVRGCRALRPAPIPVEDRTALAVQLAAVDSAIAAGGRTRKAGAATSAPRSKAVAAAAGSAASTAAGSGATAAPVDVDRAGPEDLDRLPGIGPALAARIVDDRERNGPFGSIAGLQRVRGIGPALAARLEPLVTFSGVARPPRAAPPERHSLHP